MSLIVTAGRAGAVLRLAGEVLNEETLCAALRGLGEAGARTVYLDLGGVCLPTAEGLGLLVTLSKELRARGGGLVLVNVPAETYEVFEVTHLVDVLDVRR